MEVEEEEESEKEEETWNRRGSRRGKEGLRGRENTPGKEVLRERVRRNREGGKGGTRRCRRDCRVEGGRVKRCRRGCRGRKEGRSGRTDGYTNRSPITSKTWNPEFWHHEDNQPSSHAHLFYHITAKGNVSHISQLTTKRTRGKEEEGSWNSCFLCVSFLYVNDFFISYWRLIFSFIRVFISRK